MTIHVVLNTQTAADAQRQVDTWVKAHAGATLSATRSAEEARVAVRQAMDGGTDRLIAAGGDGTLSLVAGEVLNDTHGAGKARGDDGASPGPESSDAPVIGLCPLGTGNDFARSLGVPTAPDEALDHAAQGEPVWIDALCAEEEDNDTEPRWGVNAVAGGFSGEVDEAISREQKDRWGALAFIIGAADIAPDIPQYATEIRYVDPSGEEQCWSGDTVNVICANGQTIGGGRSVAPTARLDDGYLDLVVVRHGDLPDLARTAARLLAGAWEEDDQVDILRACSARIRSTPGLKFNVDGDLWTQRPIRVATVPHALRVVAGPKAPALSR
jgi:diacylglycerol kinase (ATP)